MRIRVWQNPSHFNNKRSMLKYRIGSSNYQDDRNAIAKAKTFR